MHLGFQIDDLRQLRGLAGFLFQFGALRMVLLSPQRPQIRGEVVLPIPRRLTTIESPVQGAVLR